MWTSHLVFADLNNHSALPFAQRRTDLEQFWSVCDTSKPEGLRESKYSFYAVDNDSLMAGFSDLGGMQSKEAVLGWIASLDETLARVGLNACFGAVVVDWPSAIEWASYRGFIDNEAMLYMPD